MCLPRSHGGKGDSAEIGYQGIAAYRCLRVSQSSKVCAGGQSGCLLAPTARLTWRGGKSRVLAGYSVSRAAGGLNSAGCWIYIVAMCSCLQPGEYLARNVCSRPEAEERKQTATQGRMTFCDLHVTVASPHTRVSTRMMIP